MLRRKNYRVYPYKILKDHSALESALKDERGKDETKNPEEPIIKSTGMPRSLWHETPLGMPAPKNVRLATKLVKKIFGAAAAPP